MEQDEKRFKSGRKFGLEAKIDAEAERCDTWGGWIDSGLLPMALYVVSK